MSIPSYRKDVQVIVVDDCSPSQIELDILRSRWKNALWLSTTVNSGAGSARNVGLDAALGKWVVFADSDDEFLPNSFETFDCAIKDDDELIYFTADAVQEVDGSQSIRSTGYNELVLKYTRDPDKKSLMDLKLGHVVPWAKVYSLNFIRGCGLRFDEVKFSNDVAFNVLAAVQASNIRAIPQSTYRTFRRDKSLTANVSKDAFMQRFLVSRSLSRRLSKLGYTKVWSASGSLVQSLGYGPRIALRVWSLAFSSPMRIDPTRIFNIQRWRRFFSNRNKQNSELKNKTRL